MQPINLEKRVRMACKFEDKSYYLIFHRYFDVIAQVHSIVETMTNCIVLRVWRAHKFGPDSHFSRREAKVFRVTQQNFNKYIVPPNAKIGKAIELYGKDMLLEIEVYDEHRIALENLQSGDFVALQNVHASSNAAATCNSLVLHGGGIEKYERGISKVPIDFDNETFQSLRKNIEDSLSIVTEYEGFKEFYEESVENDVVDVPGPSKPVDHTFAKPCNKINIGEDIAVDCFMKTSNYKYHFLSHAHTDHFKGLDKRWTRKVYCSPKTALILQQILEDSEKLATGLIHTLEENIAHQFDGFQVTLIDSNHCPGAVMFIFEGQKIEEATGGPVLCTGDFRADRQFMRQFDFGNKLHWLTKLKFSKIYLDNTYFSLDTPFPDRNSAQEMTLKSINENPDKNIYMPLHRLGRESLIQAISQALHEPIKVYEEKKNICGALDYFFEYGTEKECRKIQVVKRNGWKGDVLENSIILDISMIHHLYEKELRTEDEKQLIRIPYSDHSSRSEIIDFLQKLRYESVIPTSKRFTPYELKCLLEAGKEYREESLETQQSLHQFIEEPEAEAEAIDYDQDNNVPDIGSEGIAEEQDIPNDEDQIKKTTWNDFPHLFPKVAETPETENAPTDVIFPETDELDDQRTASSLDNTLNLPETCTDEPPAKRAREELPESSLPKGVVWQDDEWQIMDMDLDDWPEGPPKTAKEAIFRMNNRRRRRPQPPIPSPTNE